MHHLELERLIREHDISPSLAQHIRRAPPGDQESALYLAIDTYNRLRHENATELVNDPPNVDTSNR
jgi:hypothetical protein